MRTLCLLLVLLGCLLLPSIATAQMDSVVYQFYPGWNLISLPGSLEPTEWILEFALDVQAYDPVSRSYQPALTSRADQARGLWVLSDRETTLVVRDPWWLYSDYLLYPNTRGWILAGGSGCGTLADSIRIAEPGELIPSTIYLWEAGPGAHYRRVDPAERIPVGQGFWMLVNTPPGAAAPDSSGMVPCVGPGFERPEYLDSARVTVDHCKIILDGTFSWNCGTDTTYQSFVITDSTITWYVSPHASMLATCYCTFPVRGVCHVDVPGDYMVYVYEDGAMVFGEMVTVGECP